MIIYSFYQAALFVLFLYYCIRNTVHVIHACGFLEVRINLYCKEHVKSVPNRNASPVDDTVNSHRSPPPTIHQLDERTNARSNGASEEG